MENLFENTSIDKSVVMQAIATSILNELKYIHVTMNKEIEKLNTKLDYFISLHRQFQIMKVEIAEYVPGVKSSSADTQHLSTPFPEILHRNVETCIQKPVNSEAAHAVQPQVIFKDTSLGAAGDMSPNCDRSTVKQVNDAGCGTSNDISIDDIAVSLNKQPVNGEDVERLKFSNVKVILKKLDLNEERATVNKNAIKKKEKKSKQHADNQAFDAKLKLFRCQICYKTFAKQKYLSTHVHTHSEIKPFQCEICKAKFSHQHKLTKHEKIHVKEENVSCKFCEKRCSKSYLQQHLLIHTKDTLYQCKTCPKNFYNKKTFITHVRIHTGERPFKCETCQKSFMCKNTLNDHKKSHTEREPLQCEYCDKIYVRPEHLRRHMKQHYIRDIISKRVKTSNQRTSR